MSASIALNENTAPVRPHLEVADIFRSYGPQYRDSHSLNEQQLKAMHDIEICRTQSMGGHVDICEHGCGYLRISYNSCRNRHCPKCQGLQRAKWLAQIYDTILPTHYFHMVFTLPHELVAICLQNRQTLYNILFQAAADSLLEFARDWRRLRAQVGFMAILHTWTQEMLFHPHIHVLVTGGGLDESQSAWITAPNNFLVPVRALSEKFRAKFLELLKKAFVKKKLNFFSDVQHFRNPTAFGRFIKKLYGKKWVVYSKRPFGGPKQVLSYLALYTHKVAISNHRLVQISQGMVTFLARDNQNASKKRQVTVPAHEFIRRFLLHILPLAFVKIRYYGLLAHRHAKSKLKLARSLIEQSHAQSSETTPSGDENPSAQTPYTHWKEILFHFTGIDLQTCPRCAARLIRRPLTALDNLRISHPPPLFQDSS